MTNLDYMVRQSEMSTWDFCRRLHHLQYTRSLSPKPVGRRMPSSGQRDTGSVYHAGAEVIHNDGTLEEAYEAMDALLHEIRHSLAEEEIPELTEDEDPEWWKLRRLTRIMLEGYVEHLEDGMDSGTKALVVEEGWEVPLGNTGVTLYGQWDLVLMHHELNGVVIDDGKTVDRIEEPHRADFQLRTYAWAWWRSTGVVPVRARHRQARRVLRGKQAKPPFYATPGIPITETILLAHEAQMIERVADIMTARTRDITDPMLYPRTNRDCSWRCKFGNVCVMIDDADDFEFVLEDNYYTREQGANE